MLKECKASVAAQTLAPSNHLILLDDWGFGEAKMRNLLVGMATTDWVAFLDDDDLFKPHHLSVLWEAHDDADIIYSDCEVQGLAKHWKVQEFDLEQIRQKNYISVTVLARKSVLLDAGGFRNLPNPDWDMWVRLGEAGVRFRFVPEVTWTYRIHAGSLIMKQGAL